MIELSEQMKADVNGGFASGHPLLICAVTPDSEPSVSFRGTAQAFSDDALAFSVRSPTESGTLRAIAANPVVVAVYTNMAERRFYTMTGRARVESDAAVRETVFDNSHETERGHDPERTGVVVIVELTSVRGRGAEGPVSMSLEG